MPLDELTELELKMVWLVLDAHRSRPRVWSPEMIAAEDSAFDKVYRAYRGIPRAA
jgi:hypothetical protein